MGTKADRYNAIFEHAHIGIIISNCSGIIEHINPYASDIFGYKENELLGKEIEALIPKEIEAKHIKYRSDYIKKPTARSMGVGRDLIAIKKDGSEFYVEISLCSYVMEKGIKVISFVNDITLRKKNERQLEDVLAGLEDKVEERTNELSQALSEISHKNNILKKSEAHVREALEKERELNEMKSKFVSMASHEFRTPLGGILTSATLIGKYPKEEDNLKREKHLLSIKRSVNNLTTILNDFLSIDKLEHGVIQANKSNFFIKELIEGITQDAKDLSQEGQRIEYKHLGEDIQVKQDKDMLRNVLVNLISNATKYSVAGKTINLLSCFKDDKLCIEVIDQGIGIPLSEQKFLFGQFFRANNVVNIQGNGLGLNIVKRYVELMKGEISFESEENVGTSFLVVLPKEL